MVNLYITVSAAAAAAGAGVTMSNIMQVTDWNTKSLLFSTFYYRPAL